MDWNQINQNQIQIQYFFETKLLPNFIYNILKLQNKLFTKINCNQIQYFFEPNYTQNSSTTS
jgi:predicted nucleic-acid-binding Zn-ribbon protein